MSVVTASIFLGIVIYIVYMIHWLRISLTPETQKRFKQEMRKQTMARFGHYQEVQVEFAPVPEAIQEQGFVPAPLPDTSIFPAQEVRPPSKASSKQESDDFVTKKNIKRAEPGSVLVIGDENNDLISDD